MTRGGPFLVATPRSHHAGKAIQRRVFRHCSLQYNSRIPLPPLAMWPAFPTSDYYGGSAPPGHDRPTVRPAPTPRWTHDNKGSNGVVPVFTR